MTTSPDWDRRIARAGELAAEYPFSAEVLNFYARVTEFQKQIYGEIDSRHDALAVDGIPMREGLDIQLVLPYLSALLSLIEKHGPPALARAARELRRGTPEQRLDALSAYVSGADLGVEPAQFFARACVQPFAEYLAAHSDTDRGAHTGSRCPLCNSHPQLVVLRPEGDGAKRSLVCSFCLLEWNFGRLVCPACGEQNNEKLPRYSAPDFPHLRVEACDTCMTYLKSVNLTITGLAVPVVDELAAVPLDLWAGERGYSKLALNMVSS